MEQRVIWNHIESSGAEHVTLKKFATHMEVRGTVLLVNDDVPRHIIYDLKLGLDWKTKKVKIYEDGETRPFVVQAEEQDKWWVDGEYDENLDGATNIDLTITPFTNTLPINRVSWTIGQRRTFKMVYVNPLRKEVLPLLQVYTYLGDTDGQRIFQYKCRDYETALVVDEEGWVVEYPGAFYRIAEHKSESDVVVEKQPPLITMKPKVSSAIY
ncbi:putative glycolipid-binding domain-containing protein [Halobacillus litoralis]|uniref:putative glycolipid-binding domain-containing protein n=1 Tax=Halobacillus litoralis TaxID=45668 RepID=UPI001CFE5D2F|nr:putative glycolipid-binding domain-containing protein [Halobacillus litoralis]